MEKQTTHYRVIAKVSESVAESDKMLDTHKALNPDLLLHAVKARNSDLKAKYIYLHVLLITTSLNRVTRATEKHKHTSCLNCYVLPWLDSLTSTNLEP